MNKIFLIALAAIIALPINGYSMSTILKPTATLTCGNAKLTCTNGGYLLNQTVSVGTIVVCECPTDSAKVTQYKCQTPTDGYTNITTDANIDNSPTPRSSLWTVGIYSCVTCIPNDTQSCTDSYHRVGTQTCNIGGTAWGSCTSPYTKCASGYYGTPTTSTTSCKACPDHASCSGDTTFSCVSGYYRASTSATSCTQCPDPDSTETATSPVGSTTATSCYLPDGTTGSDKTGSYVIDGGKCNYS